MFLKVDGTEDLGFFIIFLNWVEMANHQAMSKIWAMHKNQPQKQHGFYQAITCK